MNFRTSLKQILTKTNNQFSRNKSIWLYIAIATPILFNSLVTVSLLDYFLIRQNSMSASRHGRTIENNVESIENKNRFTLSYLPYLSLNILLTTGTCISVTFLVKRFGLLSKDMSEPEKNAQNLESTEENNLLVSKKNEPINSESYALLAYMSHELRSPLNAILGFTQIMEQELETAEANQENLAIINRSGKRLLAIINDVVDLAKIETEQLTLEKNNVNLNIWLDELEQNFNFQAASQGWLFSLTRKGNLPSVVCIDERRLGQIIGNLVDYCLRSGTNPEIKIEVFFGDSSTGNISQDRQTSSSSQLYFQVKNTTCSVATTKLNALFNPLVSVQQERPSSQGSSLNLPLSRKLSQLMGGNITVGNGDTSETGIIFNLAIPLENVATETLSIELTPRKIIGVTQKLPIEPAVKKIIGLESDSLEYRILIVDDSKTNRKIMSELLKPVGFQIREAVNGKEAIDVWSSWQPHMIWMDLRMPVMNGYEATERIKSYAHVNTPIVALSASTLEAEKLQFKAAGCDDFVGKPFAESVIFDKIAQHLGIRYIYEPTTPIIVNNFQLTADNLNVMSNQWIGQVEQAAVVLDRDLLTQLLQKIPPEHQDLQNALQKQVNDFDFERILSLARKSKSN